MEENDRRCLAALGYHELALGIRRGFAGTWSGDLPLSECSEEELEERIRKFWSLLLQEGGEKEKGILRVFPERLGLSIQEVRILIWTVLPQLDWDLREVTERACGGNTFWNAGLARRLLGMLPRLMEENGFSGASGRLEQLFFPGFFGGKPLIPDVGTAAFFFEEAEVPWWWREAFREPREENETDKVILSVRQQRLVQRLADFFKDGRSPLILQGAAGSGKTFFLQRAAGKAGKKLVSVRVSKMFAEQENAAGMAVREALLRDRIPVFQRAVDCSEELFSRFMKETARWCSREQSFFCVETEEKRSFGFYVEIPVPDRAERLEIWKGMAQELPLEERETLEELADRFELLPGQIRDVIDLADQERSFAGKQAADREIMFSSCHRRLKCHLEKRARRIPPRFSWEDLLLEERQKEKLLAAECQIRYRYQVFETWGLSEKQPYGNGVSLVFSGPPGTGKTMAAQVLAGRMGLELYRVELPAVVSKYVGETERNLNEIFEEAQASQVALFFDEADVLFGKRTDVRDSNDKYSNMEAAFLLQKMEEYSGVTILATNFLRNMDEAFKRRIRFLVEFPFPDAEWRLRIWEKAFPDRLPLGGELDLEFLASAFELSGAGIRNCVMQAAFLAAAEREPVSMSQLVRAACQEMEKNGKRMSRAEFGPYGHLAHKDIRFDIERTGNCGNVR